MIATGARERIRELSVIYIYIYKTEFPDIYIYIYIYYCAKVLGGFKILTKIPYSIKGNEKPGVQ